MVPPLNRPELCAQWKAGTFALRFFWGHSAPEGRLTDACFSQFWPCRFVVEGVSYRFAEQWMMAGKARLFGDQEALAKILAAAAPMECKGIGRTVRGFDEDRWSKHRVNLVTLGNVEKFGQDPALRDYLLATGDAILVEASPRDRIWGIGIGATNPDAADPRKWKGQNLLGFALVRARAVLRGELPKPA